MKKPDDPIVNLSKILSVLSHPTRLKILALCAVKERSARELREELGISKPLLIAHLKQLINYGFLESRAEIDEQKFIVRKYYKTRKFEVKISDEILAKLLQTQQED
jgi:ArsR family transcriptional regulator